ncbi:MAG: HAD domain-containing protein [Pseudomonadales bacterium]
MFLDFDGVLHPLKANEYERFKPEAIYSVNRILDALDAKVLSTAWRMDSDIERFNAWFKHRIIGSTPIHELDLTAQHVRFKEVMTFLTDENWLHVPWIAIDDKRTHYPESSPAFITD